MKILQGTIIGLILIAISLYFMGYGFRINMSDSLPNTLYISTPLLTYQRGKIVSFTLPYSPVTFAKILAGLPGDYYEIDQGQVYINGIPEGIIEEMSSLEYTTSRVIPEGYFFALGCSLDSFDSRYAIFGLVPIEAIKDELWPIF